MKKYVTLALFSILIALTSTFSNAQSLIGCTRTDLADPARVVYQCQGGVVLEAEAAAALGVIKSDPDQRPSEVEVDSDAVLIEVAPAGGPFQIRTPHAIAAVRGTVYVVDVTAEATSVFVSEGEVAVFREAGGEEVTLTAGDGVDVRNGEPLVVRQWPERRVRALLNRFGR